MIFDDFKNIDLYNIDKEIKDFILNLDPEIKAGRHIINNKSFINIDEYETRPKDTLKLEAHKTHIDIQFLIKGREKVFTTDLYGLKISEQYDNKKDVEFYQTPARGLNLTYLTEGKFILLYPDDVHAPCIQFEEGEKTPVKKAIVKIEI